MPQFLTVTATKMPFTGRDETAHGLRARRYGRTEQSAGYCGWGGGAFRCWAKKAAIRRCASRADGSW